MKVSNVKGLANRDGPESCGERSNPRGEALTGESAGWVLSREKLLSSGCRPCKEKGKATINTPHWRGVLVSREVRGPRHARKQPAREPGDPAFTPATGLGRIENSKEVRR
jgi:hypothetical protein